MVRKPKKRLNPDMMAESADMAAEQVEVKAPIIPTSNMNLPYNKPQAQVQKAPVSQGMSSGAPSGGGQMQGFGINVTGPGESRSNDVRQRASDSAMNRLNPARDGFKERYNPDTNPISTGPNDPNREESTSDLYDEVLRELLGEGPRDTAEEEAQIRNQMESDVSSGQAGLNARLAAGGGGTSGALGAMSTDMRSRAALDAANAITGVKDDARDEYLRKLALGMGGEMQDRSADMEEAQFDMYMEMLEQMYGQGGTPENPRADGSATNPNNAAPTTGEQTLQADSAPPGSRLERSASGYNYYRGTDGKLYAVRVRTASYD